MREVYSLKKQAEISDEILKSRLDTVLKDAMEASGIDTWLLVSKEYCEDPMFKLLTPASFLTARRITILVLHLEGDKVGKYCCNGSYEDLESVYTNILTDKKADQFERLDAFLKEIDCKKIGIDVSEHYAYFDGLSKSFYDTLLKKLSKENTDKFVSAETLGLLYAQKRGELECQYYPEIAEVAIGIIEEAFSKDFIVPGKTTCDEVEWFMKKRVRELGMDYWFSPDVNLQNEKSDNPMQNGDTVINKGDLLHCDFGINYLTLDTDTQRLAYILKDGETDIPEEIKEGYKENMRFHQIVRDSFKEGRTGNEIFLDAIARSKEEGIKAMLYTHPLGIFGHAPGPTIGLFTNQNPIYPSGEIKLADSTAYALELNTRRYLKQYDKEIYFFTEESVLFKDGELKYLCAPHEEIYKI